MPKFVQFDHTAPAPAPALGWYDTDFAHYPNLPPAADLLELSEADWSAHMNGGHWGVAAHALVSMDAPQPAPTMPHSTTTPGIITRYQAFAVLDSMPGTNGRTMLETIDAAILAGKGAGPEGRQAWLAWTTAGTFERDSPMIASMSALFNLTSTQIDTIFAQGSTVRA